MAKLQPQLCFVIPRTAGGGVLSRIIKWTRALQSMGQPCTVVIIDDRSSRYSHKAVPELFGHARVVELTFDSCDKATVIGAKLATSQEFRSSRAIVVSMFPAMHALSRRLRGEGWRGVHVEVVPSDDDVTFAANSENLAACDVAVGVSTEIAERLREEFPGKVVEVCLGGAEIEDLSYGDRGMRLSPLRVCYVGRIDPLQKRVFDLPEVARETQQRGAMCEWTIIGGGFAEDELMSRFAKAGIANVHFGGKRPFAEVRAVLCRQHVLVLPSAFEGQSNALCEAMEAGVVPLVTRVSGSRDAIEDGVDGFLADVGDVSVMAVRLMKLTNDPELWRRMSAAARLKAERRLSTKASVSRLLGAIERVERAPREWTLIEQTRHSQSRILETTWLPNWVTRLVRKAWRAMRRRPGDLGVSRSRR